MTMTAPRPAGPPVVVPPETAAQHIRNALAILTLADVVAGYRMLSAADCAAIEMRLWRAIEQLERKGP